MKEIDWGDKKVKLAVAKYAWLAVFTVVYLLIFSLWTTPLYRGWYGCDASFFTMAGYGITKGWVPYVDFFDLKGPYFFFIEALGQYLIRGRSGAFLIQCFTLYAAIIIMMKILKKFRSYLSLKKRIFIISLFLFFHIATLWGGNTLEEFMLPLSLLSLYLIIPAVHENTFATENVRPLTGFAIGVCFGIIMFSKITVAAPIAGIVIAVIITCIRRKEYKKLIIFLLYSITGILTAAAPLFIYFGIHKAILRMLYCVFIFGFKRSIDFGEKFNLRWELKISGCYFAMIFVLFQILPGNLKSIFAKLKRKNKDNAIETNPDTDTNTTGQTTAVEILNHDLTIEKPANNKNSLISFLLRITFWMALITAVLLHFGDPFIYYFTTVYPCLVTAFIAMFMIYRPFELFKNTRLDIPVLCFLITLCYFASHTANSLSIVIYERDNEYYMDYVNQAKDMATLIPMADRDDVYSFNIDMQWFEINNILPCYTYTINLQFFVALDNKIEQEIIEMLNTRPPKWIVIGGDLESYLPNINAVVTGMYSDVYDNDYGSLYLINTELADK